MSKMAEVAAAKDRVKEIANEWDQLPSNVRTDHGREYRQCVQCLLSYYGPQGPVSIIDPMLAERYSHVKYGRSDEPTYAEAMEWQNMMLPPIQTLHRDAAIVEAEDARDVYGISPFQALSALTGEDF